MIEETGNYTPLIIFPEGGTSNGSGIIKFKKGAFYGEKIVKPLVLVWDLDGLFYPSYDIMELFPLAIMTFSSFCIKVKIIELPDFCPN